MFFFSTTNDNINFPPLFDNVNAIMNTKDFFNQPTSRKTASAATGMSPATLDLNETNIGEPTIQPRPHFDPRSMTVNYDSSGQTTEYSRSSKYRTRI